MTMKMDLKTINEAFGKARNKDKCFVWHSKNSMIQLKLREETIQNYFFSKNSLNFAKK